MLDSKAVASIKETIPGEWALYIRMDYQENLHLWSFYKHLKTFTTERNAILYFKKTYPMGTLVPFDDLPLP